MSLAAVPLLPHAVGWSDVRPAPVLALRDACTVDLVDRCESAAVDACRWMHLGALVPAPPSHTWPSHACPHATHALTHARNGEHKLSALYPCSMCVYTSLSSTTNHDSTVQLKQHNKVAFAATTRDSTLASTSDQAHRGTAPAPRVSPLPSGVWAHIVIHIAIIAPHYRRRARDMARQNAGETG